MGSKLNELFIDEYNKRANIIHSVALEISFYITFKFYNYFMRD